MPRLYSLRSLLIFLLTILVFYILRQYLGASSESLPEPSPPFLGPEDTPIPEAVNGFLPLAAAEQLCAHYRLPAYRTRSHPRRIYDMFLINTELDWFTLRLLELSKEVDHFVVLESPLTFQSTPKPLYLYNFMSSPPTSIPPLSPQALLHNMTQTPTFSSKVHLSVLDHSLAPPATLHSPKDPEANAFAQERFQRNALLTQSLASLPNTSFPNPGDVILLSDIDELPSPQTLRVLRNCGIPPKTTLRTRFYYYSFQWRHRGLQWHHPQATYFSDSIASTLSPEELRLAGKPIKASRWDKLRGKTDGLGYKSPSSSHTPHGSSSKPVGGVVSHTRSDIEIWNAGWHCSSCYRTIAELEGKIGSFSHVQFNKDHFLERGRLVGHVRGGEDLFEREGEVFDRVEGNGDVPGVLRGGEGEKGDEERWGWEGLEKGEVRGRERWKFLLDRDGEDGGFEDL